MKRTVIWERRAWAALQQLAVRQPLEAKRIVDAIDRFAGSETGDIKKLRGVTPPTWRLRWGEWRIRFRLEGETMIIFALAKRRDAYE